jgi:hypothetical protein
MQGSCQPSRDVRLADGWLTGGKPKTTPTQRHTVGHTHRDRGETYIAPSLFQRPHLHRPVAQRLEVRKGRTTWRVRLCAFVRVRRSQRVEVEGED